MAKISISSLCAAALVSLPLCLGAVNVAHAEADAVYEITVSKKMKRIFDGWAEKVVVTTLGGQTELKAKNSMTGESSHRILANPEPSKTIRGNPGIIHEVQAKALNGRPTVTLKVEVFSAPDRRCNDPRSCGAPKGWDIYEEDF